MIERNELKNKLLHLYDKHSSLYRERLRKFEEMRLADELREAECESEGKPYKKRYVTIKMWSLHYKISNATLFLKETREEAANYLNSLDLDEMRMTCYQLNNLVDDPDYVAFQDELRNRYYRFKNPRKGAYAFGYDPSHNTCSPRLNHKVMD